MMFFSSREWTLIILLQIPWLLSVFYFYILGSFDSFGNFTVVGPQKSIIALEGGQATFHCHVYPQQNAGKMEVRWFYKDHFNLIHYSKDGQDQMEHQLPKYKGRTELLRESISSGIVDLRLSNIQLSDEGKYICQFRNFFYSHEAEFQVIVTDTLFKRICFWIISLFPCGCVAIIFLLVSNHEISKAVAQSSLVDDWREEKGMAFQEKVSPEERQKVQSEIASEPLLCPHEEKQQEDQKEMESNLSPFSDILKRPDLHTAQKHRVEITLDEDTAHPLHLIRKNGKSVFSCSQKLGKPKCSQHFETFDCVLGKEKFNSEKCYWEVKVEGKMKWSLGLCNDSVCRKEGCTQITPETGFWTISLKKGKKYWALSNPETCLHLEVIPKIVGIFLDYEAGLISFYNVTDGTRIYTFEDTFNDVLRPFISPGSLSIWENIVPITILFQTERVFNQDLLAKTA